MVSKIPTETERSDKILTPYSIYHILEGIQRNTVYILTWAMFSCCEIGNWFNLSKNTDPDLNFNTPPPFRLYHMSRWLRLPPDALRLTRIVKSNIYMYSGQTWLFLIQSNSWNTIQSINQNDGKLNFLFTTTQLSKYKIHDLAYLKIKCCDIYTQLFTLFQREVYRICI